MSSDEYGFDEFEYDFKYHEPKHVELESKFSRQVNIDMIKRVQREVPSEIMGSLRAIEKKQEENRMRIKDKSDRATVELVLDNRTRFVLYRLINTSYLSQVFGCISAGKEANVYYAINSARKEFAIKIYKTSILVFKDRTRYVEGEFRFRKGYSKHNPRQMVKMWAEKEMRNLKRLQSCGIPCPEVILVRQNVLMMTFLGNEGEPSPRLKDCVFDDKAEDIYKETVLILRRMYHDCHLVHADFSEYNLLYHDDQVHVIDVSQAIEHDHPQSLNFLRRDCSNINKFFARHGVDTLSVQGLFNFVVDLNHMSFDERWEKAIKCEDIEDELFKELYIPRTLHEIEDDAKGERGLFEDLTGVVHTQDVDSQSSSGSYSEEEPENETNDGAKKPVGDVLYKGLSKSERKLKVKQDKIDKRANKIPKKVKKMKVKQTAHKHRNVK